MRYPAVAGTFYPADELELSHAIKGFKSEPADSFGVVSPHAGYIYSGPTAAKACSALGQADTYVILGPNHRCLGSVVGISAETWRTPLGDLGADPDLVKAIEGHGMAKVDELCHEEEHSIEVQLPILQSLYNDFKIVPVSMMSPPIIPAEDFFSMCKELGAAIAEAVEATDRKVKVLASSDFSHALPEGTAKARDMDAIGSIKALDARGFLEKVLENDYSICGFGPIAVTIHAVKALGAEEAELIGYTSSGAVTGDMSQVVGYAAMRFV